jgi:thymidylate synthase
MVLSIDVSKHFPIITGRKMFQKIFDTEFDWFMNGETNIKRFQDAGVKIWDAWADENGDLGPVYGHQMRNFNDQNIDQMRNLIKSLRTEQDSRRHIISLWNPAQ